MIPNGTYSAVVDRIEDGLAALEVIVNDQQTELVVDIETLPEDAQQADAVLQVEIQDSELGDAQFDPEETKARAESAQSRFDRLSKRPPSRDENNDGPERG